MTIERRVAPRHPAELHAQIVTDAGRYSIGITRDLSATGLLALSRHPMTVGENVEISVMFATEQHVFTATVIRLVPLDPGESAMWQTKVALAIDPENPVLADLLASLGMGD